MTTTAVASRQGYSERGRLSQYLWKLRSRVLEGLGIPEWSLDLRNPDGTP